MDFQSGRARLPPSLRIIEGPMAIKGVQYVSDDKGKKTGVLIDLRRHRRLWEDIYDTLVAEARKDEPRAGWEQVKKRIRFKRSRRG